MRKTVPVTYNIKYRARQLYYLRVGFGILIIKLILSFKD